MRIAVIGAGISGAWVAKKLTAEGHSVDVFDKARGSGGRISTRYANEMTFDHGTPYFSLDSEWLQLFEQLVDPSSYAHWTARFSIDSVREEKSVLVGTPTSNGITKSLLEGITFYRSERIVSADRMADQWQLLTATGDTHSGYDILVVTAPAPQTSEILKHYPQMTATLKNVMYDPHFVLMLQLTSFETDVDIYKFTRHPVVQRVVCQHTKPGRTNGLGLVIQSTPEFARQHLERDWDQISDILIDATSEMFSIPLNKVESHLHRWLYGFPVFSLEMEAYWNEANGLGLCGDYFTDRSVQGAIQSGCALVNKIIGQ